MELPTLINVSDKNVANSTYSKYGMKDAPTGYSLDISYMTSADYQVSAAQVKAMSVTFLHAARILMAKAIELDPSLPEAQYLAESLLTK